MSDEASRIELRDWRIDFRDYLDDMPIHSGDQLQLLTERGWVCVRYEMAESQKRAAVLVGADRTYVLDRATMHFRWPSRS